MEKIVVTWFGGDEYYYSSTKVICVEYESVEALYCNLEEAVQKYLDECVARIDNNVDSNVAVGGIKFELSEFTRSEKEGEGKKIVYKRVVDMPEIFELQEWFRQNATLDAT
jgi:hypothetical protein